MAERIPCEFSLIRYVPDVVKGEFTNIGVVLREARPEIRNDPEAAYKAVTQVRFTRDWRRVLCMHPDADTGLLEALEEEIASLLISEASGPRPAKPLMELLSDTLSNSIQITEPRATLAETFALELEQLMRLYIETIKVKVTRKRTGRAAIHAAMRKRFEDAGVWAAMFKSFPVAPYTRRWDPMKLDCGYKPNGVLHLFHAVSLENDADAARGLTQCAPLLRDGLRRREAVDLDLAAIVEPLRQLSPEKGEDEDFSDEASELYRFGVETMESAGIRVLTVNDLARAAETARIELKL